MGFPWTDEEDRILLDAFHQGLYDNDIVDRLEEAGFSRSASGVQARRIDKFGLRHPPATDTAPSLKTEVVPSFRDLDDAFCEALRKHHPEKEVKMRYGTPARLVPYRGLPSPLFSSTGLMSF